MQRLTESIGKSQIIFVLRKWYVCITLKCKVSYLLRQCLSTKTLADTCWLTTQDVVNIISAAYVQSIIKAFYNLLK